MFFVCLFASAAALAQDAEKPKPYLIEFVGLEDTGLADDFEELSVAVQQRKEPVESDAQLRRRMNDDIDTFQKLLRARGYYEHSVDLEISRREDRRVGRFIINPGPQFTFDEIEFVTSDPDAANHVPDPGDLDLVIGEPALAQSVVDADEQILNALRENGYPFPKISGRDATVDFDTKSMQVRIEIDPGLQAVFGALRTEGFQDVRQVVAELERPWDTGDPYDSHELDRFRRRLYDTGLFTVVRVQPIAPVENGRVDIGLEVTERKHRTIGTGLSYYTDRGAGTEFFWEHRNLWNLGRKLRFSANVAQQEQSLTVALTVDRFRRANQTLEASVTGGYEDTDAYDSREIIGALRIDRELREHLTGGAGIALRFTEVEQLSETETFQLLSIPLQLLWDNSDDPLDPTEGLRFALQSEPFFDVFGRDTTQFLKTRLTGSWYYAFDEDATWIFAHRVSIGSIWGDSVDDVPADLRFYAGGGGSVRGFPYQSLGPLFADEEPIGGRSVFETSIEIRYRFAESFGVVAFVDAGSAYEPTLPDFSERMGIGAGMGLRYYSPIGPFRFDLAFPINKDDHIDDSFQVYLSLGQSF